ncbi:cyclin-domain-containing protein [Echria macrotheca]|uniref:Cyclin-domain-containing protein n=1 Tax=Echria macrotheca TaxID=438768 RepID=A0AAJ0B8E1_9PEZI|nr:cyclin-domain-containing protein [Echria macrotheca]
MATLIGDVSSRFHTMIGGTGIQRQHSHEPPFQQRSVSRSRESARDPSSQHTRAAASSPRTQGSAASTASRQAPQGRPTREEIVAGKIAGGAGRFPSPPPSSSPSEASSGNVRPQHASPGYMTSAADQPAPGSSAVMPSSSSSTSTDATVRPAAHVAPPSPRSDSAPQWDSPSTLPTAGALERPSSPIANQKTIRVRDLAHIQSLAKADLLTGSGQGILNDPPLQQMKYEISGMPIGDIIEMVAALLTKITTTNDLQHNALNRNADRVKQVQAQARGEEGENNMSPLGSSVLAFHGKNVPAITILSYLSRIHKYCPTTYEVFLSLLVYFDRMTERVNSIVMKSEESRRTQPDPSRVRTKSQTHSEGPQAQGQTQTRSGGDGDSEMRDDSSEPSDEMDEDLADDDDVASQQGSGADPATATAADARSASQDVYFVVDSFNIHRLIIAAVTCASKFFSDVFYTNSRYAKVGGLPLAELNHLELQFLLLNDFRLAVAVEDLEAYATMLVEFYAREVVAQRSRPVVGME